MQWSAKDITGSLLIWLALLNAVQPIKIKTHTTLNPTNPQIPSASIEDNTIVHIPGQGKVMGTVGTTQFTKRKFYSFKKIPYAEPPIGELRFQNPVPKKSWGSKILNSTEFPPACPQENQVKDFFPEQPSTIGVEDCLYLGVYTPQLPTATNNISLPVLFWIYGGSFTGGAPSFYGPAKFLEKDIVMVAIQYRAGPLGYLSLHTDDMPGNQALMDQLEGLRWVKKHIRAFGGNPDLVTVFGESSGANTGAFVQLSPLSKGLFHRIICHSGSALSKWGFTAHPVENALHYAKMVNCTQHDLKHLAKCLRKVPVHILIQQHLKYIQEHRFDGQMGFSISMPIIQKAGKERFLEETPQEIMETGKFTHVPGLYGTTRDEGSFVLAVAYMTFYKPHNVLYNSIFLKDEMIPQMLKAVEVSDPSHLIAKALQEKFLYRAKMGNFTSMIPGLMDLMGTYMLKAPTYQAARINSRYNNTYFYNFEYESRMTIWNIMFPGYIFPFVGGITHGDELPYFFTPDIPDSQFNYSRTMQQARNLTKEEEGISRKLVDLWINFATQGDPTPPGAKVAGVPKWDKVQWANFKYMAIDKQFKIKSDYESTWTVISDRYYAKVNGKTTRAPANKTTIKKPNSASSIGSSTTLIVALMGFLIIRQLC